MAAFPHLSSGPRTSSSSWTSVTSTGAASSASAAPPTGATATSGRWRSSCRALGCLCETQSLDLQFLVKVLFFLMSEKLYCAVSVLLGSLRFNRLPNSQRQGLPSCLPPSPIEPCCHWRGDGTQLYSGCGGSADSAPPLPLWLCVKHGIFPSYVIK